LDAFASIAAKTHHVKHGGHSAFFLKSPETGLETM
jgi:hypothetical protein